MTCAANKEKSQFFQGIKRNKAYGDLLARKGAVLYNASLRATHKSANKVMKTLKISDHPVAENWRKIIGHI
jgi:hypothetical protein